MAIRAILIFGALMLACGSAGLLVVRFTNPLLRGLGYLGGAFASGGIGAGLLLTARHLPAFVSVVITDLFVLASFTLLHMAVLELLEADSLLPTFGLGLLAVQASVDLCLLYGHGNGRLRAMAAGLLIGTQACQTVVVLVPRANQRLRIPALFVAALLSLFAIVNISRSVAIGLGFFQNPLEFYSVAVMTFAMFIAIALGLAFGIFWMTTTVLTTGLEQIASTDPLTRTYNRRVFLRWCERERDRNHKTGAPFSILMVDIDHFKAINDDYGHQVGDEALCAAVEHMQNAIRGIDVLGRWGGEEFAALLPGANADAAVLVAERLRANVARLRLPEPEGQQKRTEGAIKMTVSVGIATYSRDEDNLQQMIKRADLALYEAKAEGRNRVVVAPWPVQQWVAPPLSYSSSTR